MKVHVISFYVEPGEAGVNSIFKDYRKAAMRLTALIHDQIYRLYGGED